MRLMIWVGAELFVIERLGFQKIQRGMCRATLVAARALPSPLKTAKTLN
jgi:hypothetical protein